MNNNDTTWRLVAMDPPTIEKAAEISRYLQGQLPGNRFAERDGMTQWKLCDNETHPGFASAMVVGATDTIVSMCTVTPKRLWRNGMEQPWAEIGDTFTDVAYLRKSKLLSPARSALHQSPSTDRAYPRKGMFESLVDASRSRAQAAGFRIVYGLPNEKSLPGYVKKLGFIVKEDLILEKYVVLLSTRSLGLRTRASRIPVLKGVLCNPFIVEGSRKLAKLALFLVSFRHREILLEKVQFFGPEFDGLWERIRAKLPNAQVRDSRYLTWRYNKSPFSFDVLAARMGGQLLGYVATLTLHHEGENAFIHTILVDWLFDPDSRATREALLSGVVDYAFTKKADVVSAVVCRTSQLKLPFGRLGFVHRSVEMPVIVHSNEEGRELLADPSPWHFTLSDTDAF
jgi:hypothetical protein